MIKRSKYDFSNLCQLYLNRTDSFPLYLTNILRRFLKIQQSPFQPLDQKRRVKARASNIAFCCRSKKLLFNFYSQPALFVSRAHTFAHVRASQPFLFVTVRLSSVRCNENNNDAPSLIRRQIAFATFKRDLKYQLRGS